MKDPKEYLETGKPVGSGSYLIETMNLIGQTNQETLENILKKVNLETKNKSSKKKALAFIESCRDCGISASYVGTFAESWVKAEELPEVVQNHPFVEVYVESEWQSVDPTNETLKLFPSGTYQIEGNDYIKYAEGVNPNSLKERTIKSQEDMVLKAPYIQLQLKRSIGQLSEEDYNAVIKQEMAKLVKRLEIDFNSKDQNRFNFLQIQPEHRSNPLFYRERMLYNRLVVMSTTKISLDMLPELKETYEKELQRYQTLKKASEDSELYKKETDAWIRQEKNLE
ncbi:transglutaminase domain-containing protein [Candidatus Woesearchaeota archaeon]|nr:transglutaminase domain-containing protein [Candidatus Woesearchaeota archaeon]